MGTLRTFSLNLKKEPSLKWGAVISPPNSFFAEGKDEAQLGRGEVEMKTRSGSPGFPNEDQKLA